MDKNWTGNTKSIHTTLGANNHSEHEREKHDYYASEPRVIDELFEVEDFGNLIWEPACGEGHMSKRIKFQGKKVISTDLVYRGYGEERSVDFLKDNWLTDCDIITNPPYKYAQEFTQRALDILQPGNKVAMFLKLTFLEGQKRRKFFDKYPPKRIYVYSSRRKCAMNGDFDKTGSSAACYAWFIWEVGSTKTDPVIKWIN